MGTDRETWKLQNKERLRQGNTKAERNRLKQASKLDNKETWKHLRNTRHREQHLREKGQGYTETGEREDKETLNKDT